MSLSLFLTLKGSSSGLFFSIPMKSQLKNVQYILQNGMRGILQKIIFSYSWEKVVNISEEADEKEIQIFFFCKKQFQISDLWSNN